MRYAISVVLVCIAAAGCGSGGIEGTLQWDGNPKVGARAASGRIQNTTSHSVTLDPHAMRLLDARGRKVAGRVRVSQQRLAKGAETSVRVTWKSGEPVRIDYGAGTLPLRFG